ncbi:MAG: TIGR03936 family radical SAM-associated protein [Oscillospiraceae bacterium]
MQNDAKPIRIFFSKMGRAKYISHLDMARCMQRALKRSKLPVWHTQGFNPRMYMNFSLALSLGYESLQESFEIKMVPGLGYDVIKARINEVMPEGIVITKVANPIMEIKEIDWADYEIFVHFEDTNAEKLRDCYEDFCERNEIIVSKKSKNGNKYVDLKPLFSLSDAEMYDDKIKFNARIASGIILNINPNLIINAFCERYELKPTLVNVKRTKILTANFIEFE